MTSKTPPDDRRPGRPDWLKVRLKTNEEFHRVQKLVEGLSLHTVCQEARCPNIHECWCLGTATFLIMGDICTRHCGFCSVEKGRPAPLDPAEPDRIARAVETLSLDFAVITSVDRDDLPDQGAGHFVATIHAVKSRVPHCKVEVLIPDFNGDPGRLETVLAAGPDVLAHNIETVKHLYARVRPIADYENSLAVLAEAAHYRDRGKLRISVKSGIMVGLGETMSQILETLADIAATGCDIMTIGQYLSPRKRSLPVERFYTPPEFEQLRQQALELGFKYVESGPLVRSSYHAREQEESIAGGGQTS
jgi:lipoic acid synthetase